MLDDVVTSFDISHRRRLIRLLKEEFNDWQVILLTHDEFFFEIIKRELRPVGWITTEIGWDTENGIRFKPIPGDQLELIAMKRKNGFQVANDVRTLMEMRLKEIVCSLGVKVSFQYNGTNERRMPGELLSELRAYLNRKSQEVKSHPVFTKLEGSNVVGIAGSHDSSDQISSGDIDVVLGDLSELDQLFRCDSCKKLVGKEHVVVGKDKITCKCGKKELTWRL